MSHDGGLETTGAGPGPTTQWTRPTEFLLISRNGETMLKNLAIQWNSFRPGPSNWQLFFGSDTENSLLCRLILNLS